MNVLTNITSALGIATNHPKYYFPDGNVVYQVETTLFKIHQYFLQGGTFEVQSPAKIVLKSKGHFRVPSLSRDTTAPIFLPEVPAKAFEALLDVLYLPGLADPELIPSVVLMSALDVSEKYSLNDVSVRISTTLQSRIHNGNIHSNFSMFICCIRHTTRFPRPFVIQQFTDICTSTERIDTMNLAGLDHRITANIIQGRELVREGNQRNGKRRTTHGFNAWNEPTGWREFLSTVFPPTQKEDGWEVGPKPLRLPKDIP